LRKKSCQRWSKEENLNEVWLLSRRCNEYGKDCPNGLFFFCLLLVGFAFQFSGPFISSFIFFIYLDGFGDNHPAQAGTTQQICPSVKLMFMLRQCH